MPEAYIGTILMFAGNFAPRGWALCQGQLLSIAQNTALFSIVGTTFGGNGQTTFGLPDLRGRVPVGAGQGPGLDPINAGQMSGSANVTLTSSQIPPHTHPLNCTTSPANQSQPEGHLLAAESQGATQVYSDAAANQTMNASAIGVNGGGQPHENMQPYLGINFIICLEGIFPSRD